MILRIMFFALMAMGLLGFGTVAWISHPAAATAAGRRRAAATDQDHGTGCRASAPCRQLAEAGGHHVERDS